MTQKRDKQLTKPQHARQLMASIINAARRDQITLEKLRGLAYAVQILLKCMETSELADQMTRIEQKLSGGKR